jgi:transposase
MDDAELERRLFTPAGFHGGPTKPLPDCPKVHEELKRRGVTLMLLWEEYRAEHADGYGYSRFCDLYGAWRKRIVPTMRQTHVAGEKLFVDWAGDAIAVFDPITGAEHSARIFVAALGASNYTYAEARWSETLPDWIGAHVNALAAIGGVPKAVVCDNLKAGITKPSRYEPGINRTYQDLADHYGFVVLPTRARKPRDKAKVEVAVLIVERFVLAKLRNRRFFSLDELNVEVRECVATINAKAMRKLAKSRRELLETIDRPALKDLPSEPYRYAEWKRCGVAPDYHVEVDNHYYSVPFRLLREKVDARLTDATVEVFHKGIRVASHPRSSVHNRHTTISEHMPSAHRRYAEWTPQRIMREAAKIGPATTALVAAIMKAKPHPEQGFRSCLGIMRLVTTYGAARVEAASQRGNDIGATTYGSIASILKTGLDKAYANSKAPDGPPIRHANIRGRGYYH